jgi:transcriptional regulator with XRE-family HTH domain
MLGTRIRERRTELGIEQVELAERVGIRAQSLWRIESGTTTNPGIEVVKAIAGELRISIDALVKDDEPAPAETKPRKRRRAA